MHILVTYEILISQFYFYIHRFWLGYFVVFSESLGSECSESNNFLHNIFHDAGLNPVMRKVKKSDDCVAPLYDLLKDHNSKACHEFIDVCNVEVLMRNGECSTVEDALAASSTVGTTPVRLVYPI